MCIWMYCIQRKDAGKMPWVLVWAAKYMMGTLNELGEIRKEGIEKGESLKSLLIQI